MKGIILLLCITFSITSFAKDNDFDLQAGLAEAIEYFEREDAQAELALSKFEGVLNRIQNRKNIEKEIAKTHYYMGRCNILLGDDNEALLHLECSTILDSEKCDSWNYKGTVLEKLGERTKALQAYNKAVEINPNNDFAWFNKGNLLVKIGELEDAIVAYDKALSISPENPIIKSNKADAEKMLTMK